MIREVDFLRAARAEAVQAAQWYGEQTIGLDLRFTAAMNECVARVGEAPERFSEITPGLRKADIHGSPYNLLFEVNADAVLVVAVFHHKRNPEAWKARIRP